MMNITFVKIIDFSNNPDSEKAESVSLLNDNLGSSWGPLGVSPRGCQGLIKVKMNFRKKIIKVISEQF